MPDKNQQEAFLFMPDISGFTNFINDTETEHSTHIIRELLEIIINANELNMELMEIEGDAVFFFRVGKIPTTKEIIRQSKNIFEKFHQHLLAYESHRICQCGACRTANNLTLKFIIHSGPVGSYHIHDRYKLIGKNVILLHRLLKNRIPQKEYLLFTEPFFGKLNSAHLTTQQLRTIDESEEFDNNIIPYKYVPIKHWLSEIEPPAEGNINLAPEMTSVVSISDEINSPPDFVFSYIADLSKRPEWMDGIKKIEFVTKEKINQTGTVHECILENKGIQVFKSKYFAHSQNDYSITEVDQKKEAFAQQFTVEGLTSKSCTVRIEFLVKNNALDKFLFYVFMKNKMNRSLTKSLRSLKTKLEALQDNFSRN